MKSLFYTVILADLLLPGVILTNEVLQSGVNVSIHMFRKGKFIAKDNMEVAQWSQYLSVVMPPVWTPVTAGSGTQSLLELSINLLSSGFVASCPWEHVCSHR